LGQTGNTAERTSALFPGAKETDKEGIIRDTGEDGVRRSQTTTGWGLGGWVPSRENGHTWSSQPKQKIHGVDPPENSHVQELGVLVRTLADCGPAGAILRTRWEDFNPGSSSRKHSHPGGIDSNNKHHGGAEKNQNIFKKTRQSSCRNRPRETKEWRGGQGQLNACKKVVNPCVQKKKTLHREKDQSGYAEG